jgi:hypothetical protein
MYVTKHELLTCIMASCQHSKKSKFSKKIVVISRETEI